MRNGKEEAAGWLITKVKRKGRQEKEA